MFWACEPTHTQYEILHFISAHVLWLGCWCDLGISHTFFFFTKYYENENKKTFKGPHFCGENAC